MLVNVLRRGGEGRDEEAREQIRHLGPPGDVHHRPHQQRSLPVNIFDHFYGDKAVREIAAVWRYYYALCCRSGAALAPEVL